MIYKYLDCSTAHLPKDELDSISAAGPRVIDHEYGAWVNVPEDIEEALEECDSEGEFPNVWNLLKYAREHKCNWINFDRDAQTIFGLTVFDW